MYTPSDIGNFNLLSSYLRTSPEILNNFINGRRVIVDFKNLKEIVKYGKRQENDVFYRKFYLPKKNKKLGFRIVFKLRNQYAIDILKVLKFNLDDLYVPQDCVHGFVYGRGVKTNASNHLGNKYLLTLDIKNFFRSIKEESVKEAFMTLGFNEDVSVYLSKICTLEGTLVPGLTTSPVLANLVCTKMDYELSSLAKKYDAVYTRYADDISISSDHRYPSVMDISRVLKSYGFELNHYKTRKFKRGQNQYVTGLSISDTKYPRIPRHVKRRIRQQLHYLKLHGYHSHICHVNGWDEKTDKSLTSEDASKLSNKLKGWIDYIFSIEPEVAKKFYEDFNIVEEQEFQKKRIEHEKIVRENNGIIVIRDFNKPLPILKKRT